MKVLFPCLRTRGKGQAEQLPLPGRERYTQALPTKRGGLKFPHTPAEID